jgi:hypothetical protein
MRLVGEVSAVVVPVAQPVPQDALPGSGTSDKVLCGFALRVPLRFDLAALELVLFIFAVFLSVTPAQKVDESRGGVHSGGTCISRRCRCSS